LISSQDGSSLPSWEITISQRPSIGLICCEYATVETANNILMATKHNFDLLFIFTIFLKGKYKNKILAPALFPKNIIQRIFTDQKDAIMPFDLSFHDTAQEILFHYRG